MGQVDNERHGRGGLSILTKLRLDQGKGSSRLPNTTSPRMASKVLRGSQVDKSLMNHLIIRIILQRLVLMSTESDPRRISLDNARSWLEWLFP